MGAPWRSLTLTHRYIYCVYRDYTVYRVIQRVIIPNYNGECLERSDRNDGRRLGSERTGEN